MHINESCMKPHNSYRQQNKNLCNIQKMSQVSTDPSHLHGTGILGDNTGFVVLCFSNFMATEASHVLKV